MSKRFLILLAVGAALLLMSCLGIVPGPVVLLFHLLVGWIGYLRHVIPQVHVNGPAVGSAIACLVGVLVVGPCVIAAALSTVAGRLTRR